jgi:hypothetical protein
MNIKKIYEQNINNQSFNSYLKFYDDLLFRKRYKYFNNRLMINNTNDLEINREYNIVIKKSTFLKLKNIIQKIEEDSNNGTIPQSSFYHIDNLEISSNYKSFSKIFRENNSLIYRNFFPYTDKLSSDFNEFLILFSNFISNFNREITFSDLIESKKCSYVNYGLSVVINGRCTNNELQSDQCFEYFINLCERNDFLLDREFNSVIVDFNPKFSDDNITYVDDIDYVMFEKTLNIVQSYHLDRLANE